MVTPMVKIKGDGCDFFVLELDLCVLGVGQPGATVSEGVIGSKSMKIDHQTFTIGRLRWIS